MTLLGETVSATDQTLRTYLRSTDGGATWQVFPAFPAFPARLIASRTLMASDGSTYAQLHVHPLNARITPIPPGIYALSPGATTWHFVAANPGAGDPFTLAWNAQGHPLALWGEAHSQPAAPGQVLPGIEYHTP